MGRIFQSWIPTPIKKLDPRPVLQGGKGIDGYVRDYKTLLYYRIESITNSNNQLIGAFVLARQGYGPFATIERRRNRILMTTTVLVVLLSLLILILVRRSVTRPINQLIRRIKEMSQGKREESIEIKGRDEVASLARECQAVNVLFGITEFFAQDLGNFLDSQPLAFEFTNLSFQQILVNPRFTC